MILQKSWSANLETSTLRGCLDAKISSLNFRHSISITHHSLLITHHSSLNFSHPFGTITHFLSLNIFHTICGPHTYHLVKALLFCYSRKVFIHISLLFSHFPFPLQPCHSPKAQTQTHKNFSSSLASSGSSPVNNTQLSDMYGGTISSVVTHFPTTPTSIKKHDPFPHFVTDNLLRPNTVLLHPFLYSLTLFIYLICVIRIWVLRKMNCFSLNSVCLCFSPLFGW